jgi:hypothetical protein
VLFAGKKARFVSGSASLKHWQRGIPLSTPADVLDAYVQAAQPMVVAQLLQQIAAEVESEHGML